MKENRMVSPFNERPLKVGDWVTVKNSLFKINPVVGPARVAGIEDGGRKILVEFPEQHPALHSGNVNRPNRCWYVAAHDIEPLPMDFCIFRNETGTTYCLRGDKRKVVGRAQFSSAEGEDYNPLIGSVIAMARAYGQDPTAVAIKVLKVLSAIPQPPVRTVAAAGLEQRINDLAEQVDFLNDWCSSLTDRCDELAAKVEPKKTQLVIIKDGARYGVVGTPTKYKTVEGKVLCVGDQVKIEIKYKGLSFSMITLVAETKEDGPSIVGIDAVCDPATGKTGEWVLHTKESAPLQVGPLKVGPNEFTVVEEEVKA